MSRSEYLFVTLKKKILLNMINYLMRKVLSLIVE